ncbi:alpha/beta hydrolase [Pseudonocardia eucalypti]|uniref:Alpha/beta hydrolase n=1 Tax=Pseudonocardia eucalypti TaxID=648755 RepID=A0ABP9PTM4_9PSEU|nr:pimeloyl-ACP methyl ester carboxylesterase [Pseudonocardia eucalypti]
MSTLDVPGAHLHYETLGNGPLLLLIPGAPGVGGIFAALAARLGDRYTVVTYDRRGFSRSYLDGPQDYAHRLRTDGDDARRLIEHLTDEPATVFGSSSGAVVALQLLTDRPDVVRTLIPYEPCALRLLPGDGREELDFCRHLYDLYRRAGTAPALAGFREYFFPECDHAVMSRPAEPATAPQIIANASYWFERELCSYTQECPDGDLLTRHADRIVPAVGRASRGYPTYTSGIMLGEMLDRAVLELPGGHTGYITDTADFAAELLAALN